MKGNDENWLILKSWSDTRKESCVFSVKITKFQTTQIRYALQIHLVQQNFDVTTTSDARSLANFDFQNYIFLLVWLLDLWFYKKWTILVNFSKIRLITLKHALIYYKVLYFYWKYKDNELEIQKMKLESVL